jgi:glutathione S-transferase
MKLLGSLTSPYARKLRVIASELDLPVTWVETTVMEDPAALLAVNPLGKVPVLVLADGEALFDSPVIAGYLFSLVPGQALFPTIGMAHWQARTTEAIADGILDAALTLRFNAGQGVTSGGWVDRQYRAIDRGLAALAGRIGDGVTYAELCAVVVCEYLDLRFGSIDWRGAQPKLAALHTRLADRESLLESRPPG